MPKRADEPFEWEGVVIDETVDKKPNGDVHMECKWCGSRMVGGPSRIRSHFVKPLEQTVRTYAICGTCLHQRFVCAFPDPIVHF